MLSQPSLPELKLKNLLGESEESDSESESESESQIKGLSYFPNYVSKAEEKMFIDFLHLWRFKTPIVDL